MLANASPVPSTPAALPSDALARRLAEPAALPSEALARRLADLCGEERNVLVDFLLHLDEFDRRRAWLEAGYGSLWTYCLEVLHLRESAAGRKIAAMKLLRRFPALEAPLRDARLCLSTLGLLGPLLTDENVAELVQRAAFLSKADTERLVVSIQPRTAPRDGVRRVSVGRHGAEAVAAVAANEPAVARGASPTATATPTSIATSTATPTVRRPEVRPISSDTYSLRVTLDAATKAELDALAALLSHTARGDLGAVLREAIRCALAKHGRRKGAVAPERKAGKKQARQTTNPRHVPAEVRREVWRRDGGCCAWTSADGKRCGSTWKLQLGHLVAAAHGGEASVSNIQLQCLAHNILGAVRVFGRAHMAPFLGEIATPGGSDVG